LPARSPPHPPLFPYTTLFRSPSVLASVVATVLDPAVPMSDVATAMNGLLAGLIRTHEYVQDGERGEALISLEALIGNVEHFKFLDRKSTRLNSSHGSISYAVF